MTVADNGVLQLSDYLPFMLLQRYGPVLGSDLRESVYKSLLGGTDSQGNAMGSGGSSFDIANFTQQYLNDIANKYDPTNDKEAAYYNWTSNEINTIANNLINGSTPAQEAQRIAGLEQNYTDDVSKSQGTYLKSFLQGVQRGQNQVHMQNIDPQRYYPFAAALAAHGADPTPILTLVERMSQAAKEKERHDTLIKKIAGMKAVANNGREFAAMDVYNNWLKARGGSDRHKTWLNQFFPTLNG